MTTFQSCCRGYLVRQKTQQYMRSVIIVQSIARRWLARRRWRELKVCDVILCKFDISIV
jgi:hypothetical protein